MKLKGPLSKRKPEKKPLSLVKNIFESSPKSKRIRLDSCLICNKESCISPKTNYRKLMMSHLFPSANYFEFDNGIFKFCTACSHFITTLTELEEQLDAILERTKATVDLIKFTMIMQKSSGDIKIDYFRRMAVRDLKPYVKLDRSSITKKCVSNIEKTAPSLEEVDCDAKSRSVSLSPKVRMDFNNALINKRKSVKTEPLVPDSKSIETANGNTADKNRISASELLVSTQNDTHTRREEVNKSLEKEDEGDEMSVPTPVTPEKLKLYADDNITSEVFVIQTENKDYPFFSEIEQFELCEGSTSNDIADPLGVDDEMEPDERDIDHYNSKMTEKCFEGFSSDNNHTKAENIDTKWRRPTLSYNQMIVLAIRNSKSHGLHFSEICGFISDNFPFYRSKVKRWEGWLRTCLSNTACFTKILPPHATANITSWWTVNDSYYISIRKSIMDACEKSKDWMEFPERLKNYFAALCKDKVTMEEELPETTTILSNECPEKRTEESVSVEANTSVNNSLCSSATQVNDNTFLKALLGKAISEESSIRINQNFELECANPPTTPVNEHFDLSLSESERENDSTPTILNSFSIQATNSEQVLATTLDSAVETNVYFCPTFSPDELAFLALTSSSQKTLGTRQIIEFIAHNFPYYRNENSWKKCVYESLNTNRCYFRRNFEQGNVGPLITWTLEETEPHYSKLRFQLLASVTNHPALNYRAAIDSKELQDLIQTATSTLTTSQPGPSYR